MLLSSLIISNWGSCSFHAYPFNRSVVSSLQVLSSYQVLPLFSTGLLSEIFLTPCAILIIVLKVVCCWFHQVSSHLLKFMFNFFHLQLECCQNYIILIHSYLVSTRVVSIPSCPLYSSFIALQPPRFTWCSLFLFSTVVLSIVFNCIVFFLSTFQPLKVLCFHPFVKEAT